MGATCFTNPLYLSGDFWTAWLMERIDWDRLKEFERNRAEDICKHFFPHGRRVGNEWKFGDVSGVPGTGTDGGSLGVQLEGNKAGLWRDRATGAGGRLRNLIAQSRGITDEAAVDEIERAFGLSFRANGVHHQTNTTMESFDWSGYVSFVTERELIVLARWRGYTLQFCRWLANEGLLGLYRGKWAFPVADNLGQIIGCHYLSLKLIRGGAIRRRQALVRWL